MIRGTWKKWRFPIPILYSFFQLFSYPSLRVNMLPFTCLAQACSSMAKTGCSRWPLVSPSLFDFSVVFGVLCTQISFNMALVLWWPCSQKTTNNGRQCLEDGQDHVGRYPNKCRFGWRIDCSVEKFWHRHVNNGNPTAIPFFKKHAVDSTSVSTPGVYNSRSFPWRPIASVHMGAVLKPMQGF